MNVSYIIQAQNEADTIGRVIAEIQKTNPYEIIVVINGSTDKTGDIVRSLKCTVIHYKEPLGINIGKAIGAFYAKGDILVFLDGDIVIKSSHLQLFTQSIRDGHDIALNDLSWVMRQTKRSGDPTSVSKITLNLFLKRGELGMNALGAIPNAFSRHAIERIGWWNLTDPPLAQTIGILNNLSFHASASPNVISTNKIRSQHIRRAKNSPYAESTSRIIGDHLQAIHYLIREKGKRGGFADNGLRLFPNAVKEKKRKENVRRSAVISLTSRTKLPYLIETLKKASVDEIVVVGTTDELLKLALKEKKVKFVSIPKGCRLYTARAIGALNCSGEAVLFLNSDQQLALTEILPFYEAIEKNVDVVVLNENDCFLKKYPLNARMIVQHFLNIAVKKPQLQSHSFVSVPHAIHRRVIEKIGAESLMIPPLAYLKAILQNVKIRAVQLKLEKRDELFSVFLGDHIEAIHYYLQTTNERGCFADGEKKRKILEEIKKWGLENESI